MAGIHFDAMDRSLPIVLALSLLACGSDAASTAPAADATINADATVNPDAMATTDAMPAADAAPPDAVPVTVVEIRALVNDHLKVGVPGATVSVLGANPANETTTDANGAFSLVVSLGDTIVLQAQKTDYMTGQLVYSVPDDLPSGADFYDGMDLFSLPMTVVDNLHVESASGARDPAKGIVSIYLVGIPEPISGGERVEISAASGFAGVFNNADELIAGDVTLASGLPEVIFLNVDAGTTAITLTNSAGYACVPREAQATYPVEASVWTLIRADCTAL